MRLCPSNNENQASFDVYCLFCASRCSLESRLEVAQNLLTAKEVELANTKAELLQYKQRSEDLASKVRARACAPK